MSVFRSKVSVSVVCLYVMSECVSVCMQCLHVCVCVISRSNVNLYFPEEMLMGVFMNLYVILLCFT